MVINNYYVLLVESSKEEKIKSNIEMLLEQDELVLLPTRELYIKRKGKTHVETRPLFGGYLFLYKETISGEFLNKIKQIKGFYKFLNTNRDIKSLTTIEVKQLGSFLKRDYKATISKIIFNNDDKIVVKEGPLKEFEGRIIKVDKRKQRAKIQLSMYNESHTIDFSFDDIGRK